METADSDGRVDRSEGGEAGKNQKFQFWWWWWWWRTTLQPALTKILCGNLSTHSRITANPQDLFARLGGNLAGDPDGPQGLR